MPTEVASIEVTLRLLGAERFQTGMRESGSISEQTGSRVKRALDGIASSTDRVSQASLGLTRSSNALSQLGGSAVRAEISISGLTRSMGLLQSAVGGLAGGVALNAFKNYADTATNIQNRLATVVPIQAQRAAIDQQIFETAQRTRTSYEATANIFSRMTLSASTLGASQSEILRAVEITQKALQAGGATTAESASIATQLTQALGSSRLNGDELKSIAENSPVLIQAIAKEFGVAVGALKDMGAQGELVSSRVFKAILNAGAEVDTIFSRTSPTIAAGIQQVDNALTRYIGNVDKSIGATKALVGGLEFVARNLDTIGDSAALAVAALAGPLGARLLGGAGSRVAAPFRDARTEASSRVDSTRNGAKAAADARLDAEIRLMEAQEARAALENQPRFRQASPDVQRAYERQAAQVDRLREASAKTADREAEALLKRADAEGAAAQISQTAATRLENAKARLGLREQQLVDLVNRRAEAERTGGQASLSLSNQIERAEARVASQRDKVTAAEDRATQSRLRSAEQIARKQTELDAAAVAATVQRRAVQASLDEAQGQLSGLTGQVGISASAQRAEAIKRVELAQSALNRASSADEEASGRAAEAARRASVAKVALAGAARLATDRFSSMVSILGGPLGAALTTASVGLIGYELYQARATARVEEHTQALGRLTDRLQSIRAQNAAGNLRSDQDLVADRATLDQAHKAVRDRRDSLLSVFERASYQSVGASDLGGGVFTQGVLDLAAANLGVSLSKIREELRTLPPSSAEAATAAGTLNRIFVEAATIDPKYGRYAVEVGQLAVSLRDAGVQAREFEEARRAAAEAAKGRTDELDFGVEDFAEADIDAVAKRSREAGDEWAAGFNTQVQTGVQITDSILGEGERAKAAFQEALGQIDTTVLDNALRAVGSGLDTVKSNLDGTKASSGEAAAASVAFAQALQLIQQNQPDLAATIAQINAVANAYRQVIGLQSVAVAGPLAPGSDKMTPEQAAAAAAKQREQSLKTFNERLEAADKTPAARQRRIGRALPGLTDAEISRLDAAENPGRKGGGRKSPEQRNAETLSKKLEELDQDASVAALNDFDQKTVRFAQSAKVASEQIQAFIAAAKGGDLPSVPPVMQEIYEKMRLLEGVKLGKAALNDIFPGRLLAEQIESVRRAAQSSPEIAANLDLIEQRLREKGAPEWAKDFTSSFSDMAKSVVAGTATAADALASFKTRLVGLALDVAFKPIERALTGFLGGGSGGAGAGLGDILGFFTGSVNPLPTFAEGMMPGAAVGVGGEMELPA
ncbi:tape measure protein [Methylorubrum extorquens]